jgi:phage shock protein A
MDFKRIQAARHAELDEALLRAVLAEKSRIQNKLQLMLAEIEGAHKIVAQYQREILELQPQVAELRAALDILEGHARDIASDKDRWDRQLA